LFGLFNLSNYIDRPMFFKIISIQTFEFVIFTFAEQFIMRTSASLVNSLLMLPDAIYPIEIFA